LNHPHICTLYDIGRENDSDFLVMEYLEGQSLADRLKKGTLPLEQALQYGIELADALSAAHRQGVIHRDVKPGNVMLVKAGVKLLDFGLAKVSFGTARKTGDPPTAVGTILGTLQYMAPEQLEGGEASARTDIFAFGAVLYEMVTGRPAFEGKSQASLIASIMTSVPPPVSTVRPVVPDALDHVIQRCLAKDPEERWQSAYDLKRELQWIAGRVSKPSSAMSPTSTRPVLRQPLAWALLAIGLAVGLSLASLSFNAKDDDAAALLPIPFSFGMPPGVEIADSRLGAPAISADGSRVVFSGVRDSKTQLYVKSLSSQELPQPLQDTEGASDPFWSADGRFIGFFADGKLKRVASSGGNVTPLCPAVGQGGDWNKSGDIVYANGREGLYIVSNGGDCKPLTRKPDDELRHLWPHFLPDGRHFIYSVWFSDDSGRDNAIYISSLDSPDDRTLVDIKGPKSNAIYAKGHLLVVKEGELWAWPFDENSRKPTGEPARLPIGDVDFRPTGRGYISASANGLLAYRPRRAVSYDVMQFDRSGAGKGSIAKIPHEFLTLSLSADEKKIAYFTNPGPIESLGKIKVLDVSSAAHDTFNPDLKIQAGRARLVWSPNPTENLLYFTNVRCVDAECPQRIVKVTPGQSEILLRHPDYHLHPLDVSRDGKYLLLKAIPNGTEEKAVLSYAELTPKAKLHEIKPKTYRESTGRLSPDSSLLAYTSNESGVMEVYVRSFPFAEGRTAVSRGRGYNPHWRNDGEELVYVDSKGMLMSVSVAVGLGSRIDIGPPKRVLELPVSPPDRGDPADANWWTMTADAQTFYVAVPEVDKGQITVLVNWTARLKQ
jgi:serine/threonine protein kinase